MAARMLKCVLFPFSLFSNTLTVCVCAFVCMYCYLVLVLFIYMFFYTQRSGHSQFVKFV